MNGKDAGLAQYLFHQGTNFHAYLYLGCHGEREGEEYTYTFRVWAPNARAVAVAGDFTDWQARLPLTRASEKGVWEGRFAFPAAREGQNYKYAVTAGNGETRLKGDPYAFASEGGAGGASIITHASRYTFCDGEWMEGRRTALAPKGESRMPCPIHIYELHAGSFARSYDEAYFA